jgi:hypothetical protein
MDASVYLLPSSLAVQIDTSKVEGFGLSCVFTQLTRDAFATIQ